MEAEYLFYSLSFYGNFFHSFVETLGDWVEEAVNVIKSIGRLLGQRLGISLAETMQHLFQSLAVCLWRGNAALWLHRSPNDSPLVDGHS